MSKKVKIVPMPAGAIMHMIAKMVKANPYMRHPVSMEDLLRAKDIYFRVAAKLN